MNRLLGVLCVVAGALLLFLWVQQRVLPGLLVLPPVPFFDNLVPWSGRSAIVAAKGRMLAFGLVHLAAAAALLATGGALLARRRLAVVLFPLTGWAGLALVVAALWPGDTLRFKARTAVAAAQRAGRAAADATFWDLVPAGVVAALALVTVAWLALLVAGTIHVVRRRGEYR